MAYVARSLSLHVWRPPVARGSTKTSKTRVKTTTRPHTCRGREKDKVVTQLPRCLQVYLQHQGVTESMKSNEGRIPKPVTLSQCVATVVTFRRLLVVCGILPLAVAALPLVVGVYIKVMDLITSGFGFLCTIMACWFTILGRCAISLYAPSAKNRDDALAKSRVSLPLGGFMVGRILIRYVLDPVATWSGLDDMLMYSPKLAYIPALRLSACMLLLGAVVLARFVGPVSVGKNQQRCSLVTSGTCCR